MEEANRYKDELSALSKTHEAHHLQLTAAQSEVEELRKEKEAWISERVGYEDKVTQLMDQLSSALAITSIPHQPTHDHPPPHTPSHTDTYTKDALEYTIPAPSKAEAILRREMDFLKTLPSRQPTSLTPVKGGVSGSRAELTGSGGGGGGGGGDVHTGGASQVVSVGATDVYSSHLTRLLKLAEEAISRA